MTVFGGPGDDTFAPDPELLDSERIVDPGGIDTLVVWNRPGTDIEEFYHNGTELVYRYANNDLTIRIEDTNGQYAIEFVEFRDHPTLGDNPNALVRRMEVVTDTANITGVEIIVPGTLGDDSFEMPTHTQEYGFVGEVHGGPGRDKILLSSTASYVAFGGSGADTITGVGNQDDSINGGFGADTLSGGDGDDAVSGNVGNDRLDGGNGDDRLWGDEGDDQLRGGAGSDFLQGGAGDDFIDGGDGFDRVDYRADPGGVTVNLATGTATDGYGGTDTIANVERVLSSRFSDTLIGSSANEQFQLEGADTVDGGGGIDLIFVGPDVRAIVDLAAGTAQVGNDVSQITNIEQIGATNFGDTLMGDDADNYFYPDYTSIDALPNSASGGKDIIDGRGGIDVVDFEFEASGVEIDLENGTVIDGRGNRDRLISIEIIYGSNFVDRVQGSETRDEIYGDDGGDRIFGLGDNDLLYGEIGNDLLRGGDGNDQLFGGDDRDDLYGESGDDFLDAGLGGDLLDGGAGRDELFGRLGNDRMWGGTGADRVWGGNGADRIGGDDGNDELWGGAGDDTIDGDQGNDQIWGGSGNDLIRGNTGADVILGEGGADDVFAGDGDDEVSGGDGDDTIRGEGGFDELEGGAGNDDIHGGDRADNVLGQDGNDTLFGERGADRLFGGIGDDQLNGGGEDDRLWGGAGTDTLNGDTGDDRLLGGGGDDFLEGGDGFDVIDGGAGSDSLTGGLNADTFVFEDGFGGDEITDFNATNNLEKIDLSGVASITSFADLQSNHMSQVGSDVIIDAGGGDTIRLWGVDLADLNGADFQF